MKTPTDTIQRYFSRKDAYSIDALEDIFSRNSIFFIEHSETKLWIQEVTPLGNITTNDPLKAVQFETKGKALTWMVANKISIEYTITEHEFINPKE